MKKKELVQIDVNKCFQNNLDFNEYVVLNFISLNREIPKLENIENILKSLSDKCFISIEKDKISLRAKTKTLFNVKSLENFDVENWVDEYRGLFPTGVKSGGYPVRGIKKTCVENIKKYMLEFNRTKEEILESTKIYVEKKQQENFNYMMLAHFFIYKNGSSMIESYIEDLEERGNYYEENFHKNV